MPVKQNYVQISYNKLWQNTIKSINRDKLGSAMLVRGKITGYVDLSDIEKSVFQNEIVALNSFEIRKSKKLHEAIRKGWLEIVKGVPPQTPIKTGSPPRKRIDEIKKQKKEEPSMSKNDLIRMAREMAQTMSKEMLKNNGVIREIATELAEEMVKKINANQKVITVEKENYQDAKKSEKIILEDNKPENVFIDIDEKGPIQKIDSGKEREGEKDLSSSLNKMKMFRRKKGE